MSKETDCIMLHAEALHGFALARERAGEIAAQLQSLDESLRAYAGRTVFEDEQAAFYRALSALKVPTGDT